MKLAKALFVLLIVTAGDALSFETQTHTLITKHAYDRSTLARRDSGSVFVNLGFDRLGEDQPFNVYWSSPTHFGFLRSDEQPLAPDSPEATRELWELCNAEAFGRPAAPDELDFSGVFVAQGLLRWPLDSWLLGGVVREDDVGPFQAAPPDVCEKE